LEQDRFTLSIPAYSATSPVFPSSHGLDEEGSFLMLFSGVLSVQRKDGVGNGPEVWGTGPREWHRRAGWHHVSAILDRTSTVIRLVVLAAGRFNEW